MPEITVHDLETDEIIVREMNEEELAIHEMVLEAQKASNEALEKNSDEALEKTRQARAELLERLGLTEDEAKLLLN